MKKVWKLQDLDCANCAAKMENAIRKIPGVQNASVNFMAQKLTLEAEDSTYDQILEETVRVMHKVEPDCQLIR